MKTKESFEILSTFDKEITPEQNQRMRQKITQMLEYVPQIGIFGKTGVGKSSLCNALFGSDICKVSDIEACTRNTQKVLLSMGGGKGINLIDVPGVGEDEKRDAEYSALYKSMLPQLDVILWVLKADDRAYSIDLEFFQNVVKPHLDKGIPFIMVLNQADKIEPFREWNSLNRKPGEKQRNNIELKRKHVADLFGLKLSQVIPVSAEEKYGLTNLVDEMIFSLPNEKKISVATKVDKENLSAAAKEDVKRSFTTVISDTLAGAVKGAAVGAKLLGKPGAIAGAIIGGICGLFGF